MVLLCSPPVAAGSENEAIATRVRDPIAKVAGAQCEKIRVRTIPKPIG